MESSHNNAKERYAICKQCKNFNDIVKICGVCKCFMPVKTRLLDAQCPKDKWPIVQLTNK